LQVDGVNLFNQNFFNGGADNQTEACSGAGTGSGPYGSRTDYGSSITCIAGADTTPENPGVLTLNYQYFPSLSTTPSPLPLTSGLRNNIDVWVFKANGFALHFTLKDRVAHIEALMEKLMRGETIIKKEFVPETHSTCIPHRHQAHKTMKRYITYLVEKERFYSPAEHKACIDHAHAIVKKYNLKKDLDQLIDKHEFESECSSPVVVKQDGRVTIPEVNLMDSTILARAIKRLSVG
jgi:hypothetical protein